MNAILTLSLGATYPAPPSTRRGTIEIPIAAVAACPKNLRRETEPCRKPRDPSLFFTAPPNPARTHRLILATVSILLWFTTLWTTPPLEATQKSARENSLFSPAARRRRAA